MLSRVKKWLEFCTNINNKLPGVGRIAAVQQVSGEMPYFSGGPVGTLVGRVRENPDVNPSHQKCPFPWVI